MRVSRRVLLGVIVAALAAASPTSASAATTLGSTSTPGGCVGGTWTYIQPISPPATSYAAAAGGVITSWSFQATAQAPTTIKLRVLRPTNTADTYTTIGLSQPQSPPFNQLSTYPAQIAVQPGDFIGYTATSAGNFPCGGNVAGFDAKFLNSDPSAGSTDTYGSVPGFEINISARLEADADGDGYGDETQDLCPTDSSTQAACRDTTAPDTEITKRPKARSRKRRGALKFTSTEVGSTFQCAVDGSGFSDCTSPLIKTFGRGKHVFQVRAVDAAGNRDQTPAVARWKVKKRKHRR